MLFKIARGPDRKQKAREKDIGQDAMHALREQQCVGQSMTQWAMAACGALITLLSLLRTKGEPVFSGFGKSGSHPP
jgi:hypothetical protein